MQLTEARGDSSCVGWRAWTHCDADYWGATREEHGRDCVKCVSSLAVDENPHLYLKVGIFFACPRITCLVFLNPTEESVATHTLWRQPAALFPTRSEERGQTAHSVFIRSWSNSIRQQQADGWLMKMFRMFEIASHLVRSNVPRRNILESEFKQGRGTLLQNKRRFTAGHKACVLGVTRVVFLLYVGFELILEFTEGKMKWNKMQYNDGASTHRCRRPFTFTDILFTTLKSWTQAVATVVPKISLHFIAKIKLWPLSSDMQLLHPAETHKGIFAVVYLF